MTIPLRVLIVEDSENDTLLLVKELRRGGYEPVYERVDSLAGMKAALETQPWDIVLSDYTMPDFRGTDALLLLREKDPDVPFIYVSGTMGEDMAVAAMKAGANDYVIKGNLKRLIPAIRRELRESETRRERRRLQEERDRLFEETQRNLERIRALHEIDKAIASTLDLRTVLEVLLEKIELFLPIGAATTVRLLNRQTGEFESFACRGVAQAEWSKTSLGGRAAKIAASKKPLVVRNLSQDPLTLNKEFFRKHGLISYLGVPLIAHEQVLGVLGLYTNHEHSFTDEEIEFLTTLAGQAAIAIHNAQLYEQMVRANKVKDEFLSVMSHELRTPLNVVVGYAGMIRDGLLGEVNPQQIEGLGKIMDRANDQLAMVNNILFATVLESEKINVERHPLVLGDFFKQLSSAYETLLNKPVSFKWDCANPLAVIHIDSPKLKQILHNLIDNAVKFTSQGSITISAKLTESSQQRADGSSEILPAADRLLPPGGKWVELRVSDTGVGIPKEHLPYIFEKFRQVDSSETRLYGGVGMGLYIVKKFAELLGGTVEVESEVGKGSTFIVKIPTGN
jgi:signal transduction histidine kinase/DNA-binding response OmpR family regulator